MRTRRKSQKGVGHSQPKTFSGPSQGKTLKKCKNNGKTDNIVIDIDDDDADNINSSVPIPIIICSDEEDETSDINRPATASEATSSSKSHSSQHKKPNTTDGEGAECQFLHEIESPVKLSKCKRTYSAKAPTRNRYGLDLDFDGDQSDKDQHGSDYMEDNSGEIQAEWERANKRKKKVEVEKENKTGKPSKDRVHVNPDDLAENDAEASSGKCAGKDPPSGGGNAHKDLPWGIPNLREREQEKVNPVPMEPFLKKTCNGAETEPNGSAQREDKDGPLQDEAGGDLNTLHNCLINNREKLKETDEYKRAEEEEWASRQQALRLQAEEAQKMRQLVKRQKSESLRLLDMERRQKQRVEEIRETQKKDEENMNMKEKLRTEVRLELRQLELKSFDMGSLLRGLGVHVSGGIQPQPQEIRTAYKKALLSFHPDRAPASDIRKLVEAEEKFKLISRMKEKLMPTS